MLAASLSAAADTACIVGTFYNSTTAVCEACASGTYQDEPGQTSCKECPAGTADTEIVGTTSGLTSLLVDVNQCYDVNSASCIESYYSDQYCDQQVDSSP
eukprot:scaffold7727_cov258-Pinguiococcus_pyrenoidosus.AAC.9